MAKPFEHDGHSYTFERSRGTVKPIRDDGCTVYNTFPSYRPDYTTGGVFAYPNAHLPAFATIAEAKAAIMGQTQPTMIHRPIWAHDAIEAQAMRHILDKQSAAEAAQLREDKDNANS